MALRNESVKTIDNPSFINLQPDALNPGISKCEIKVMYVGKNRNGSYMDRNAAIKMANTLPGVPIVAAYHEDKEDFGDHGEVIHIENGEVSFSCATVPYGFVAPDAQCWFQRFTDTDKFGNEITREYLMTTGYLWTGQYPEITKCITEGQGQSMELDDVDGEWSYDNNTGMDFFIINDATIMKLCVLGDDVEPCFEGASVTDIEVSKDFALKGNFNKTLFSMMNELKDALNDKGGLNMSLETLKGEPEATEEVAEEPAAAEEEFAAEEEAPAVEEPAADDSAEFASDDKKQEDAPEDSDPEEEDAPAAEDKKDEEEPEKKHALDEEVPAEENSVEDIAKAFEALTAKFEELKASYDEACEALKELRQFKLDTELAEKDAAIAKYHMLSDEDKAEVIEHKEEYSLDEINAKLALIYVQKNVDFDTLDGKVEPAGEEVATSFTLVDNETADEADELVTALREAIK